MSKDLKEILEKALVLIAIAVVVIGIGYSVKWAVEEKQVREDSRYDLGSEANSLGIPATANPYRRDSYRETWLRGWMDEEIQSRKERKN